MLGDVGSPVRNDMRPRFAQHLWITQSFMAMKSYEIIGAKLRKIYENIYIGQSGKISEYVLVNQGIFGLSEFQTRHGYNATRYCLHTWSTFCPISCLGGSMFGFRRWKPGSGAQAMASRQGLLIPKEIEAGSPSNGLEERSSFGHGSFRLQVIQVVCALATCRRTQHMFKQSQLITAGYGSKLGTLKLWIVHTKLDIHICGPLNGLPFWSTSSCFTHELMALKIWRSWCGESQRPPQPLPASSPCLWKGWRSSVKCAWARHSSSRCSWQARMMNILMKSELSLARPSLGNGRWMVNPLCLPWLYATQ